MTVEFLPSDEPDDQPDAPPTGRPLWHRRGWLLVVALLIVGATGWALTRPSSAPKHVATPRPSGSTRIDPACRGVPDCAVHADVPVAIDQLAQTYLPAGMRLRVRTVVTGGPNEAPGRFVERDIDAVVDSVTVLVRLQRGGSGTQEIEPDPPGIGSLMLHELNSGYVVRLQYLAPETVPPMLDRLRAFIRDPRLASS